MYYTYALRQPASFWDWFFFFLNRNNWLFLDLLVTSREHRYLSRILGFWDYIPSCTDQVKQFWSGREQSHSDIIRKAIPVWRIRRRWRKWPSSLVLGIIIYPSIYGSRWMLCISKVSSCCGASSLARGKLAKTPRLIDERRKKVQLCSS